MKTVLMVAIILMIGSFLSLWVLRRRITAQAIAPVALVPAKFTILKKSGTGRSFLNDWQVTPQHDDRTPTLVVSPQLSGYAPADRSTARRSHQRMYRQWSGERHD